MATRAICDDSEVPHKEFILPSSAVRGEAHLRGSRGEAGEGRESGDAGGGSWVFSDRTGGPGSSPHRQDWDDLSPAEVRASSTSVSDCTGVPPREPLHRDTGSTLTRKDSKIKKN